MNRIYSLLVSVKVLVAQSCPIAQSCPTLCDPMDSSMAGASVHEILQVRILKWVVIPFSRGSSYPEIEPRFPELQTGSFPSKPEEKPTHCKGGCIMLPSCGLKEGWTIFSRYLAVLPFSFTLKFLVNIRLIKLQRKVHWKKKKQI